MTDEAMLLIIMFLANYFLLWRKGSFIQKVTADLLFITMGMAMYLLGSINYPWGIMIAVMAIIDMVIQIFGE